MNGRTDEEMPLLRAFARSDAAADLSALLPVIEASSVGMVVLVDDAVVHASARALDLLGIPDPATLMSSLPAVCDPLDRSQAEHVVACLQDRTQISTRIRVSAAAARRTVELRVFAAGSRVLLTVSDATAEAERMQELARFSALADATSDLIGMADVRGRLIYVNPAARRFHGIALDTPTGEIPPLLGIPEDHLTLLVEEGWPRLRRGEVWEGECDVVSGATGDRVPFWAVWVPIRGESGEVEVICSTFRDLSERRRLERRLAHAAAHDPLTGLPNRERLFEVLSERSVERTPVAVLFCDLDDFKIVNDTLGHAVGDRVLRTVAERLVSVSRITDVVGRLGGDEFLVICEGIVGDSQVLDLAERISEAIHEPMLIGDREYRISVSIGISVRPGGSVRSAGELVTEADIAMYRAKEAGRRHVELFDATMRTQLADRLDLERDLRLAIEQGQIETFFQPVMDLRTGRLDGLESLVRWRHPERGVLPPSVFLELAESCGLGVELGDVVIDHACRAVVALRAVDPTVQVGFNVSTAQMRSGDLCERIVRAAQRHGAALESLVLEVTEETVMTDAEGASALLRRIRSTGLRIAVDDFGTGYSSLAMLRRLPVDVLKIDRSFVDGLGIEPGDTQIVRLVLSLADELGLMVVAEGVETEAQRDELVRLGCPLAQGYLFARPMTLDEVLAVGAAVDA